MSPISPRPAARFGREHARHLPAIVLAAALAAPAASQDTTASSAPEPVSSEPEGQVPRVEAFATGPGPGSPRAPAQRAGRSLILVVDTSASMALNDPGSRIREAVAEVAEGLADEDLVGLVSFDTAARMVASPRVLAEPGARATLSAAIAGLEFRGRYTSIPDAIERALYELQRPGRASGPRLMVLVTDGIIDTGSSQGDAEKERWLREDLLPSCRREGIRIFSVAFTESADYKLLRTLSTTTGGGYYRALTPADVPGIFDELERALSATEPSPTASPPTASPPTASPPTASAPTASHSDPAAASLAARPSGDPAPTSEARPPEAFAEATAATPPTDSGGWASTLLIGGLLAGLLALAVAALALLRVRRSDAEALPIIQATLHELETGRKHLLDRRVTRIGRAPENDIVIDSPTISGQHAHLEARDGVYRLVDLRSTNGTYLNESRVDREAILRRGDVIRFDRFKFAFDGLAFDEETRITTDSEQTQVRVSPWGDRN